MATKQKQEEQLSTEATGQGAEPVKAKSAPVVSVTLKPNQALVSKADNDDEDNYFITSVSDWQNKFSKQTIDGKPKYKLIQEKKS